MLNKFLIMSQLFKNPLLLFMLYLDKKQHILIKWLNKKIMYTKYKH